MRSRADKIEKVLALAAAEERRFGEATGASRRRLEEQQQRLGELHAFRADYAAKSAAAREVPASHWKDYHGFLSRLDSALRSQQQIVQECEKNLETHRQRWMVKRQRLESLERVLDKYRDEERVLKERREQRVIDDRAPSPRPFTSSNGD